MKSSEVGGVKHILLVDDDRLVLATLSMGLSRSGFKVSSAESAEEAEAYLASGERPDLVILDVRMSGAGGLYLARRLHELDRIPFIMLSAYSDPESVAQATQSGAFAYAVKPLDVPQLIPTIEAALARAQEFSQMHETRQQLQKALDAERNTSVAVGIIIMRYRVKRSEAFALLRDAARKQRKKLADLADEIVQASDVLHLESSKVGCDQLLRGNESIDF
jgi:AmiR/NasT family two-component response regulator